MSILVLGGTGFIGRRVVRRLVGRGEQVVCLDINPSSASFMGTEDRVKVIRGDITQFEELVKVMMEERPDRVLNLAFLLGGGEENPHFTMRINVVGMDNCFEAARLCGINRVVYGSSIAVTGPQKNFGDRLVNEDDPCYGITQYARHKIFNEFQAGLYIKNYGMSITGLRAANTSGPDRIGPTEHVQCITLPAHGQPFQYPWKSRMVCAIHVEDVAEAFVRVTLADTTRHPIYNTGGTTISLGDLAELVRSYLPDSQIIFESSGAPEESPNYLVDNSRLLDEFELEYVPYPTRVLEIINDIRTERGLPPVAPK